MKITYKKRFRVEITKSENYTYDAVFKKRIFFIFRIVEKRTYNRGAGSLEYIVDRLHEMEGK